MPGSCSLPTPSVLRVVNSEARFLNSEELSLIQSSPLYLPSCQGLGGGVNSTQLFGPMDSSKISPLRDARFEPRPGAASSHKLFYGTVLLYLRSTPLIPLHIPRVIPWWMFTREVPNTGHLAPASLAPALLPLYPLYKGGGMQGTTFTMGVPGREQLRSREWHAGNNFYIL